MDYRSHVSGAQNTAFKVILFVVLIFPGMFFPGIFSYAADITVGSEDVLFTRYRHVTYKGISGTTISIDAYSSMGYSGGNCYYVSKSALKSGAVYILNPDGKSLTCDLIGSSSGTFMSKITHGSGSSAERNTKSPAYFLSNFSFSDPYYSFDVSSYDYSYFYLFVRDGSIGSTSSLANVEVFNRAAELVTPSPVVTPSPIISPSPVPSSTPVVITPAPSDSGDLSDYSFWAVCYNQMWKDGESSSSPFTQRYTASSVSDLSDAQRGITNYIYTYQVRIPFHILSNFSGSGMVDAYFRFAPTHQVQSMDDFGGATLIDFSTPWIESSSGLSFNAVLDQKSGAAFDLFNIPIVNAASEEFYFCYNVYFCAYANFLFTGYGMYIDVTMSPILFNVTSSTKISDLPSDKILDNINNNIVAGNEQDKQFHEDEIDEANKAIGELNSGLEQITGTLNSWEIVTMPVTVVQDLVEALRSDGSTGLTFPSVTIMGQELWPDYTFDLQVIAEQFPVLYNSLHIISGILIVGGFLHYLWRKWHILTGDDTPEE